MTNPLIIQFEKEFCGCGEQLKIGQGNLSPNGIRELEVGIRCGEIYKKDKFHKNKGYIGKRILCPSCSKAKEVFLERCREELNFLEVNMADFMNLNGTCFRIMNERISQLKEVLQKDGN